MQFFSTKWGLELQFLDFLPSTEINFSTPDCYISMYFILISLKDLGNGFNRLAITSSSSCKLSEEETQEGHI